MLGPLFSTADKKRISPDSKKDGVSVTDKTVSDEELAAIARLMATQGMGPVLFFQLYEQCGSALNIIRQFSEIQQHSKIRRAKKLVLASEHVGGDIIEAHKARGITLLSFMDEAYPPLLRQIYAPPPMLSVLGNPHFLKQPLLGVSGARNASLSTMHFIRDITRSIVGEGWGVVSGLARGVDTSAHLESIKACSVAVLAGGVDVVFPLENAKLYEQMLEEGCLVSEMPLGTNPKGGHFPRRNRIIAGLARGTLIAEARFQSGSLHTAQHTLDAGRPLFVVPGSPMDPRCAGSNALLKDGAHLVTGGDDILQILGQEIQKDEKVYNKRHSKAKESGHVPEGLTKKSHALKLSKDHHSPSIDAKSRDKGQDLLALLGSHPIHQSLVLEEIQLPAQAFFALLTALELEGKILHLPGGLISRA